LIQARGFSSQPNLRALELVSLLLSPSLHLEAMPLNSHWSGIMIVAAFCGVDCNAMTVFTGSTFGGQADSRCDGAEDSGDADMVDLIQVQTTLLDQAISHKPGRWRSVAVVRALSLFQQQLDDAGRGKQFAMPDLRGLQQSMAQMVSESMERKEARSDLENQTLEAIVQQMNTLIAAMPQRQEDAQLSLDEKRQVIVNCVDEINRHHFATNHSNAIGQKNKHSDCRMDEWGKKNLSEETQASLSNLVASPGAPSCMTNFASRVWLVAEIASLLTCVNDISEWADRYSLNLEQAKDANEAAMEAYNSAQTESDTAQHEYEEAFCMYRMVLTDSCAEYTACYDTALAEEAAEVEIVRAVEEQLKTEYRAVRRIVCLVEVLQANVTQQQGQLDDCLEATYPTGRLNITYNDTDQARASCDISNVSIHPCDDLWLEQEYESKSWFTGGVETVQCVPCFEPEVVYVRLPSDSSGEGLGACRVTVNGSPSHGTKDVHYRKVFLDIGADLADCQASCSADSTCVAVEFGIKTASPKCELWSTEPDHTCGSGCHSTWETQPECWVQQVQPNGQ